MHVNVMRTKAEYADRDQDDGEGDEDGPCCACEPVPGAFEPLEAAEDLSRAPLRHPERR